MKECLASVAGKALRLGIEEGKQLFLEAGILVNRLLASEYDSGEALDQVDIELEHYRSEYEKLRQKQKTERKLLIPWRTKQFSFGIRIEIIIKELIFGEIFCNINQN